MGHTAATDRICVDRGYSVITWWNGSFGDSTEISHDQVRQNAQGLPSGRQHRHRSRQFPAVTRVYDVIRLIHAGGLTTVTLADVFTTTQS